MTQKFLGDSVKKTDKCFWCSHKKFEFVANRVDEIAVVACLNCGLMQTAESPSDLEDFYTEDYYNPTHKLKDVGYDAYYTLMNPLFLLWQSALLDVITEETKKYTLLDVGCATGNLMEIIQQYNPNIAPSGIDISEYAVEHCQKKDLDVTKAYIEEYSKNKFDIIVSLETLEHLDDLKIFTKGIRACMKDKGSFMFYVPSVARHELEAKDKLDVRLATNLEHLIYFTPEFFQEEFSKFFKQKVYVKEIITEYGRSIVGLITGDTQAGSSYNELFDLLTSKEQDLTRATTKNLENSIVMAAKFYSHQFSETIIKSYSAKRKIDTSKTDFLKGVVEYHKGSLASSINHFLAYYEQNPKDIIALKVLLANEALYNSLLLSEVGILSERLECGGDNKGHQAYLHSVLGKVSKRARVNAKRLADKVTGKK